MLRRFVRQLKEGKGELVIREQSEYRDEKLWNLFPRPKCHVADGNDEMEIPIPRLCRIIVRPIASSASRTIRRVHVGSDFEQVFETGRKVLVKYFGEVFESNIDVRLWSMSG